MSPDAEDPWPKQPKVPTPTYCTPEEVAMTLDLPDPDNNYGYFQFSDMSHPSRDQVCRMICANEDIIDRRLRKSWRVNYVKDYQCTIPIYQWDEAAYRTAYYANGGNYVQLRKDILPWDPEQGDRLEFRTLLNTWRDASELDPEQDDMGRLPPGHPLKWSVPFYFDHPKGRLFLRTRRLQQKYNALRISYRWGSTEPVPPAINRLCCLLTAMQVINMQAYSVKVGLGGDIAGVKDQMLKAWQDEINTIYSSFQRTGSVHSLYR